MTPFATIRKAHEEAARRACSLGLDRAHPIARDKLRFVPACVACPGDG